MNLMFPTIGFLAYQILNSIGRLKLKGEIERIFLWQEYLLILRNVVYN
jgi:hypothetical protein